MAGRRARRHPHPGDPGERPHRLRPLTTQQEKGADQEAGESLVVIDNPDDADLYPPTETPRRSAGRQARSESEGH
ncbi:hypothetical protein U7230_04530 [Carboxydochorda subterranea]|uniref:Uncharacterized protein n=1 Tax=Carboxydichorda subterranea TaxID=3109565 RepID=A0ABZ1BZM2_9FIRM|nr:hypothetical protein [Limnochorda sp. L945t]WRP18279.1 hypothetical protein U7230_04530 [Limnochorda sp. L945t]